MWAAVKVNPFPNHCVNPAAFFHFWFTFWLFSHSVAILCSQCSPACELTVVLSLPSTGRIVCLFVFVLNFSFLTLLSSCFSCCSLDPSSASVGGKFIHSLKKRTKFQTKLATNISFLVIKTAGAGTWEGGSFGKGLLLGSIGTEYNS